MRVLLLLVTLSLLAPFAAADEWDPDCEPDQRHAREVPGLLVACEGEHWDGQDASGVGTACTGTASTPTSVGASWAQCPENGAIATSDGSIGSGARHDPFDPVGARVGAAWADGARGYAAGSAFGVGVVAVSACAGECGAATVAAYYEDGSPGHFLTILTHPLRITQDAPQGHDACSYEQYEERGGMAPLTGGQCYDDNEAVTITLLP